MEGLSCFWDFPFACLCELDLIGVVEIKDKTTQEQPKLLYVESNRIHPSYFLCFQSNENTNDDTDMDIWLASFDIEAYRWSTPRRASSRADGVRLTSLLSFHLISRGILTYLVCGGP